ncbi:Hypothetical protein GbCGDNIH9_8538 [Granulibacter bethesdensis]|uniref:Uncharacterized protein n=1 Tax=Granulibacter bethesdensis TaxID=364410 RepID=A0AAC9KA67_9PROT|nr:Hypothetical protein GbCGDNIH9_8538 [Granulibacter bethesdensis]APH62095.1 Hypothetical protein GbCGDNIH8_8538 [Granulibacter bethesdensis]
MLCADMVPTTLRTILATVGNRQNSMDSYDIAIRRWAGRIVVIGMALMICINLYRAWQAN